MSAEEQKHIEQEMLWEYAQSKKRLAAALYRTESIGRELEAVGKSLQSADVTNLALEVYKHLLNDDTLLKLQGLVAEIKNTQERVSELRHKITESGLDAIFQ